MEATKIVLLLSDGEQSEEYGGQAAAAAGADAAKAESVTIFAWGFGEVSQSTLEVLASDPSQAR